jgi:hypothetical protein
VSIGRRQKKKNYGNSNIYFTVAKNIHNLHQKKNPPKETKINPSRCYYY